jgi:hypothetical protein
MNVLHVLWDDWNFPIPYLLLLQIVNIFLNKNLKQQSTLNELFYSYNGLDFWQGQFLRLVFRKKFTLMNNTLIQKLTNLSNTVLIH